VAPAFAVAERAEAVANGVAAGDEVAMRAVTHDSETPAPSAHTLTEPQSEAPTTLAAVEPPAPTSVEPGLSEPSAVAEPAASGTWAPGDLATNAGVHAAPPSELVPSEAFGGPVPPSYAAAANGIENGVAHAPSRAVEPGASSALGPSGAEPAATPAAAEVLPEVPGLVLIEAERRHYLYWELGSGSAAPFWLHVVSHTPAVDGHTERRERRFPVQQRSGALRIEGVPAEAVMRAKLSRDPDGRPVAVAGAVRSHDASFEIQFSPHRRAPLEAIARRAEPVLARATPVYWDC
jgi:hypothetical protein